MDVNMYLLLHVEHRGAFSHVVTRGHICTYGYMGFRRRSDDFSLIW